MRYDAAGQPTGYVSDWIAVGLDQLTTKWRGKPLIAALLGAYLGRVQDAEDALWELFTLRFLDTAEGAQLDVWGRVVGEPRNGTTDAQYRLRIALRVLVNRSRGTWPELLVIAQRGALQDTITARQTPSGPATAILQFDSSIPAPSTLDLVWGWLYAAKAAGVRLVVLAAPTADGLRWDSHVTPGEYMPGWDSHVTPGTGGAWYRRR